MGTVGTRTDPTEAQILKAIGEALASGQAPDDDYWSTKQLSALTGLGKDRVNGVVEGLLESGLWVRSQVVRVSALTGYRCRVMGFKPKEPQ